MSASRKGISLTDTAPFVAFYTHALYNGGIERALFNLAASFVSRNVRVDFVVDKTAWTPFTDQLPEGVRLVDLGATHIGQRPIRLARYLRRERPRAILSANHFSNEVAVFAAWWAGIGTRVMVTEHTTQSVELRSLPTLHPRRLLLPAIAKAAYRRADAVVAVSKGVAQDVESLFGLPSGRVRTIYNAVITPDVVRRSHEPLLHPWFAPGQPPVVLGIGRLELQKDFASLIRAFGEVRAAMDARLVLLGEGSRRAELAALTGQLGLESDVKLDGFVTNPYPYLRQAKVFVLSSAWEGLGNVLIEALACGTPVVSTDCPSGPAEILDGGRFGTLVPVGDAQRLATAILAVLRGTSTPVANASWLEQFTPGVAAQHYIDALGLGQWP